MIGILKNRMKYYEVAPASRQFHGSTLLTYQSTESLKPGQIIVVKIRRQIAMAFVIKEVDKPDFKTVSITETLDICLPPQHIDLFEWLREYYPSPVGLIAQLFLPFSSPKNYLISLKNNDEPAPASKPLATNPLTNLSDPSSPDSTSDPASGNLDPPQTNFTLTKEQQQAIQSSSNPQVSTILLHGDTGTGKTLVYIERAKQVLQQGQSVLVLVPEIALSPQIVKTFTTHIKSPVHVTHSDLTPAQRRKVWQSIYTSNEPQVVIGPRSALFTPLDNIGLIVMDEFHEPAYKQDQAPYYQTIRAASQFARLHQAHLILGSATPPVSEYYIAEQKNIPIVGMTQKPAQKDRGSSSKLQTIVVNLKEEIEKTKYPLITTSLINSIKNSLNRREQILLFLNKRGSARLILCQSCGWHATCGHCDLPLTFHGDSYRLQCHTCGRSWPAPSICPECSSHDILFKSPGTKAIVDSIQHLFPETRIARFDRDNRKAERLETRHDELMSGEIDILIGTQLLAKGHDLPRLGMVGILLAENELQFPDYTSSERSYQLMHQLIGRVGRGHRPGTVVVQTYDPDNLAVRTATRQQVWQDFYRAQIEERKLFEFPPFYHLMKIEVSRARLVTVKTACQQIVNFIRASDEPVKIIGPAPSFIERQGKTYNWQIIVKAKQRSALTYLAAAIPVKCTTNLDPNNLL